MRRILAASGIIAVALTAGCSSNEEHIAKLRSALDRAELSLADSVEVAEVETSNGIGVKAALLVDSDPVFSIGALASEAFKNVRVDIVTGEVISMEETAQAADACADAVSLEAVIAAAEAEVGGQAVAVEPEDDGPCMREVKVLADDDTLWEVAIAQDGSIIEVEEDDDDYEDGGEDD